MKKNKMNKKWKNVAELIRIIAEDDTLDDLEEGTISKARLAPHIGYAMWVFKYKGTPVCIWHAGNSHYTFHSVVSHIDILIAWLYETYDWFRYTKELKGVK